MHFFPRTTRPELDESADSQTGESQAAVSPINDTDGWSRFRGPNGRGVSADKNTPTTWSETENLAWKTALPGFGASSPVLTDEFVAQNKFSEDDSVFNATPAVGNGQLFLRSDKFLYCVAKPK